MTMSLLLTALSVALLSVGMFEVSRVLGEAGYMDEVFHVPQAQAYCQGQYWVWNKKITTFPGLYLFSSGVYRILQQVAECDANFLRFGNALFVALTFYGCVLCRRRLVRERNDDAVLHALMITTFPLSAFYYFLYYTDTASTCLVVLAYYTSLRAAEQDGGLLPQLGVLVVSAAAVSVRQTNAVWLLFFAGTNMLSRLQRRGQVGKDESFSSSSTSAFLVQLHSFVLALLQNAVPLLLANAGLLLTVLGFVAFVVRNGGVVVGDKENHRPALHLALPLHMAAAAAIVASLPRLFSSPTVRRGLSSFSLPTAALASAALIWGSFEHPFLLADNRHLTFYLWRRALRFPAVRALLGPVYSSLLSALVGQSPSSLWLAIFAAAAVISLAPSPLLELRYFTPGIVVFLLNAPPLKDGHGLAITVVVFLLINACLLFVFLYRPFLWPDGSTARFML